ncbi:MAG: hypothetical protein ACK4GL_01110 [Flavobacteriales bacterium]
MNTFKAWFDAKEIPIFALASNVRVKSDNSGAFTIMGFDEIVTSNNISDLRNRIPKPEMPTHPEKREMFDWRFADDDGQVDEAFLFFDDTPSSLAGESTDMDLFGENYVIFWIVQADKEILFKAMLDAIDRIRKQEKNDDMIASVFMDDYISRIYFVQHDLHLLELHQILENAMNKLIKHIEETEGEDSVLLQELNELMS